ncbi:MAG TPA: carboxypeptidase regulatory-like domain-containing protein [Opitutaceae bacterium]|jgi:hypothetical protein
MMLAGVCALAFALLATSTVYGQGVTTSSVAGFVTGTNGAPLVGATVTVTRVNTGTRFTATTRASGQFNIPGLSSGGPYTIAVTATNYTPGTIDGITLGINETYQHDFALSSEIVKMEAVTVQASQDPVFDSQAMGSNTEFSAQQIQEVTSVRQDVQDLENLDPRANLQQSSNGDVNYTLSVQGQNPRESLFLIDGVTASDNFGLNSDGYAGLKNPVPLPWIESISLDLEPYDIIYSNFLGAVLNTTLKSGTNSFHGSVYELYTGTNFRGQDPVVGALGKHEPIQSHTYGASLGGPIIKNKLFFFAGYEAFREIAAPPPQTFFPDPSQEAAIVAKAESLGDTNPGSAVAPIHAWSQNFVGKLDWNISDDHHFEFTFRHTDGLYPLIYNYTFNNETSLSGSWYSSHRIDQSYTAKVNSNWDKLLPGLSSEIEGTYRKYNGTAELLGPDGPAAVILNVNGVSTAGGTQPFEFYLGPSPNYQFNQLYTEEMEEHAYGEYSIGNHTFKFGGQLDRMQMTNAFVPNYYGTYFFTTVQDYLNQTPTGVTLATYNKAAGFTSIEQTIAHYAQLNVTPLLEDTWKPNEDLTIVAGLRMDYPYEAQKPTLSSIYLTQTGVSNQTTINGDYTISPRLGFNYNLPGQTKTQIRGGMGLFLGAPPFVWLENSFSTAGVTTTYTINDSSAIIPGYTYTGNPATQALPPNASNGVSVGTPSIDVLQPGLHLPANWKENIAIDHELPFWHITATAEADFSQVQEDLFYQETNLKLASSGPTTTPDGAIRYGGPITPGSVSSGNVVPGFTSSNYYVSVASEASSTLEANSHLGQILELSNTDLGGTQEYTLMLHRPMIDDWSWSLAYTHTHATQVATMGGTTAGGGYGADSYINPNDNVAYRSAYSTPNKVVGQITKRYRFFHLHNSATTISAQYIGQTGVPYSYTFKGDADGSGNSGASLFYVPTGPSDPKVAWISPTEETNFFTWLGNHPELEKWAGKIAPRNEFNSAWQHTVDLHVEQQVPIYGTARLTLFADCFNFANLINRKWGLVHDFGVYNDQGGRWTVAGTGYNPAGNGGQGQYQYTFNSSTLGVPTIYSDMSRYMIQIGGRLEF